MKRLPPSPLAEPEFLTSADCLPKAHPPWWLAALSWLSLLGLAGFLWSSLLGPMDEYVVAPGEVRPADYTLVFSPASGVLQEMLVEDGDHVVPGQPVARLWLLPEQAAIDPDGLKPFAITSPAEGKVLSTARLLEGERVGLGTPLVKLVRGEGRTIRLYASEDRIDRIEPGLEVRFRVRSNPDRLAPYARARVIRVARDRDLTPEDRGLSRPQTAYYVKAEVEDAPYELPFGAGLDAEIILQKRPFWQMLLLRPRPAAGGQP